MYIRMTSGRFKGEVRDQRYEEAVQLIADGRAIRVNFDEPNAMEKKEIADVPTSTAPAPIKTGPQKGRRHGAKS